MLNRRISHLCLAFTSVIGMGIGACEFQGQDVSSGWANYYVQFDDRVIDRFGNSQQAWCEDDVSFDGDIDWRCADQPMVWSYDMSADVRCHYRDSRGVTQTYTDYFHFDAGYIAERACEVDGWVDSDLTPHVNFSILGRSAEGEVVLSEDVTLSDEPRRDSESDAAAPHRPDGAEGRASRTGEPAEGSQPDDA